MKICKECKTYKNIIKSGGNNDLISLVLIKFSLEQVISFMKIIDKIITNTINFKFERSELFNFNIRENLSLSFSDYLKLYLGELSIEGININNENNYNKLLILKALFILLLINDDRVKLFVFGDHNKNDYYSEKLNKNINLKQFLDICNNLYIDFKNNHLSLSDIGYYSIQEWNKIGLYCF